MFNNLSWITPAETYLPLSVFFKSFHKKIHSNASIYQYVPDGNRFWANKARDLLSELFRGLLNNNVLDRNSEVLIPGYTCPSVPMSIRTNGLKISLYDLDPITLSPNIESIKKAINDKTRVIIIQYLFGVTFDLSEIIQLAKKHNLILVEDVSQGLGSKFENIYSGFSGDFSLFSFGRGKSLPALGGGLLVDTFGMNTEIFIDHKTSFFPYLIKPLLLNILAKPFIYGILESLDLVESKNNEIKEIKSREINTLNKILIFHYSEYIEKLNVHRKFIAKHYHELFKHYDNRILIDERADPTYIRYPVLIDEKEKINKTQRKLGIRRMYKNTIDEYSVFEDYIVNKPNLYGCKTLKMRLVTLPTHLRINKEITLKIAKELLKNIN